MSSTHTPLKIAYFLSTDDSRLTPSNGKSSSGYRPDELKIGLLLSWILWNAFMSVPEKKHGSKKDFFLFPLVLYRVHSIFFGNAVWQKWHEALQSTGSSDVQGFPTTAYFPVPPGTPFSQNTTLLTRRALWVSQCIACSLYCFLLYKKVNRFRLFPHLILPRLLSRHLAWTQGGGRSPTRITFSNTMPISLTT